MKTKTKTEPKVRAPIVKELHYSEEEKKEIERIKNKEPVTQRKERLRECSICVELPSKRIYYNLQGVTRIEAYCDEHFLTYERTKNIDIKTIAESFNCTIAEPDAISKIKVEGYNEGYSKVRPKSSMSSDSTARCNRCGFRIRFSEDKRGPQGGLIPLDMAGQIHNCGITMSFPCRTCNEQIYLDAR